MIADDDSFRRPPPGINSIFLSPVLGAPELLVPSTSLRPGGTILQANDDTVDEIPYQSKVTGQEEKLPFVIGLMSLPGKFLIEMPMTCLRTRWAHTQVGTDLPLMGEVHRILDHSGKYHAKVFTGKNMFPKSD